MTLGIRAALLALAATTVAAQYGPGGRFGGGSNNDDNNGAFGSGQVGQGGPSQSWINSRQKVLVAHGVLASLAFVLLFPAGSILIRLGSFRGAWLVHGLFQLFAYLVYTAAVGIGIWLAQQAPAQARLVSRYHPIIGLVLFAILFFQPIMGYIHHLRFKKLKRRTLWSYGHLWLGRIAITLGIINGGLGLLLAYDAPLGFAPTQGQVIAYGVVAGIMWLLYVAAAFVGERRRAVAGRNIDDETGKGVDDTRSPSSSRSPHKERYG
ncbi:integral membrane protein [Stagonosporopsis vannaccii]|nr:integral membrane protein [Stagonosporopsis vannaccii]